jgi:flagellar biosynthetic protein FliR
MNTDANTALINFLVIMFRCLGFFALTPIFGRREIPVQVKVGLAGLASFIVLPLLTDTYFYGDDLWSFIAIIVKEVIVGLTMGYISLLIFSSLYLAGGVIDMMMGFGIVNVMDTQSNTPIPLMGNFFYIIATLIFLTVNGHHVLIRCLVESFRIVPIGKATFGSGFIAALFSAFSDMLIIAVKVCLPVISIVLLTDLALGLIARTVPHMNVFLVGLPIKIVAGIIGIMIMLPLYITVLDVIFNLKYENIVSILRGMWNGP